MKWLHCKNKEIYVFYKSIKNIFRKKYTVTITGYSKKKKKKNLVYA